MRRFALLLAAVAPLLVPASPGAAQNVWLGPEIPVNSVTAGSQFAPAVSADGEGNFAVAWQSADGDGSGFAIRARRFAADGTPATAELAVNATTAGDQVSPSIVLFDDGRFVVAWASNGQDGSGFGIYARRFAANGAPLGGEFRLNSTTTGNQTSPHLVRHGTSDGGFFAAWTGPGLSDSNEIFARGFDAAGLPLVAEFRVNLTVPGLQFAPALLARDDGSYVAAWQSEGQDGSGYAVVARRFSAAGAFLSGEIAVPQVTALDQTSPAITATDDGFVVAWQRALQATPQPFGPQPVICFRRFDATGVALGDEKQVNNDTSVRHEDPALSSDSFGGFTVAWKETNLLADDRNVAAARYDALGLADGGDFTLNSTLAEDQIDAALAPTLIPGRFVAAWASFAQDGSSFGVFAQRLGRVLPPCVADAETLCLDGGRFLVTASFATAAGATGDAQAEALTDESGYFTFFNPENVEIVVKSVDACDLAGFENFWIFATGLTNVEVALAVVDTATGDARVYRNPLNQDFQPILDTGHFQVCDTPGSAAAPAPQTARPLLAGEAPMSPLAAAPLRLEPATVAGGCVADAETLCLLGGRFEVKIDWTTAIPSAGPGLAVALTDESGYFWFFDAANVELVIKVVDGCTYNDRYWIFAGGLTDVGTDLLVRDTATPGATFHRVKPIGVPFAPILSIDAFDTCP